MDSITMARGDTWIDRDRVRRLRAGMVKGLRVTKAKMNAQWRHLTLETKEEVLKCPCQKGGIQDTIHLAYECEWTYQQMNKVVMDYGAKIKGSGEERLIKRWGDMTRTERIDEIMCLECTDTYTGEKEGRRLKQWIMERLAALLTSFEKVICEGGHNSETP